MSYASPPSRQAHRLPAIALSQHTQRFTFVSVGAAGSQRCSRGSALWPTFQALDHAHRGAVQGAATPTAAETSCSGGISARFLYTPRRCHGRHSRLEASEAKGGRRYLNGDPGVGVPPSAVTLASVVQRISVGTIRQEHAMAEPHIVSHRWAARWGQHRQVCGQPRIRVSKWSNVHTNVHTNVHANVHTSTGYGKDVRYAPSGRGSPRTTCSPSSKKPTCVTADRLHRSSGGSLRASSVCTSTLVRYGTVVHSFSPTQDEKVMHLVNNAPNISHALAFRTC